MALRDHTLDDKITSAARAEFLEKGYMGASLRKIAGRAGVTVGAIQTRCRSKDALFRSLLEPLLRDMKALFQSTKADYHAAAEPDFLTGLRRSMEHESAAILRLLFDHYEEAVLLLCRSGGSSLEHCFDETVQRKIAESILFIRGVGFAGADEALLGLLISAQFDTYRRIVADCADRARAEQYLDALMVYHLGGWTAFFRSCGNLQGGTDDEV